MLNIIRAAYMFLYVQNRDVPKTRHHNNNLYLSFQNYFMYEQAWHVIRCDHPISCFILLSFSLFFCACTRLSEMRMGLNFVFVRQKFTSFESAEKIAFMKKCKDSSKLSFFIINQENVSIIFTYNKITS